jgi:hypothetical protein
MFLGGSGCGVGIRRCRRLFQFVHAKLLLWLAGLRRRGLKLMLLGLLGGAGLRAAWLAAASAWAADSPESLAAWRDVGRGQRLRGVCMQRPWRRHLGPASPTP